MLLMNVCANPKTKDLDTLAFQECAWLHSSISSFLLFCFILQHSQHNIMAFPKHSSSGDAVILGRISTCDTVEKQQDLCKAYVRFLPSWKFYFNQQLLRHFLELQKPLSKPGTAPDVVLPNNHHTCGQLGSEHSKALCLSESALHLCSHVSKPGMSIICNQSRPDAASGRKYICIHVVPKAQTKVAWMRQRMNAPWFCLQKLLILNVIA